MGNSRDDNLRTGCDFSFSGLKSAVKALIAKECGGLSEEDEEQNRLLIAKRQNIAACFQKTCVQHLIERVKRAVIRAEDCYKEIKGESSDGEKEPNEVEKSTSAELNNSDINKKVKTIVVAGGVAANTLVRTELTTLAKQHRLQIMIPPPRLCVDNGVMVAWTGIERFMQGLWDEPPSEVSKAALFAEVRPKWPLGVRDSSSVDIKEKISARQKKDAQKRKLAAARRLAVEEEAAAAKRPKLEESIHDTTQE